MFLGKKCTKTEKFQIFSMKLQLFVKISNKYFLKSINSKSSIIYEVKFESLKKKKLTLIFIIRNYFFT